MNGREFQHQITFKMGAHYDVIFIGELLCSIRHKDAMIYSFQNVGSIFCADGMIIPMRILS